MQDRVSTYPGRITLTPVSGNTYDWARADDPSVVGTPLNKATFLPDAVASAFETATGVSGISLPADALDAIATFISGLGTVANIARCEVGSYTGAGGNSTSTAKTLTFGFKPRFLIVTKYTATQTIFSSNAGSNFNWIYGLERGDVKNIISYTDGDTSISWTNSSSSDVAINRLDASGSTYLYFCVGVD